MIGKKKEKKPEAPQPEMTTLRINLLDWRSERRELRKRQFNSMLVLSLLVSAGIVLLTYLSYSGAIDHQNDRNEYLKQQIAEVDLKIKEIQELEKVKRNLLSRMRVIEELQTSRSATVHFFDELVNTLPEGVSLTSVKQTGTGVVVDGVAESNARVSTYMKNLDASKWFDDPRLIVIKTNDKGGRRQSEFQLQVKNLTKPAEGAGASDEVLE